VQRNGLSLSRLMRESTDRIGTALHGEDDAERVVAMRIVETPAAFQRWESEHVTLMRDIAGNAQFTAQVGVLKRTTLSLMHGKALFEHLKTHEVRGAERISLMHHFYPNRGYTAALVAEHGNYLRKTCSYLCTSHVGTDVARDDAFLDPMAHYQELYAEYFDLYCRVQVQDGVESAAEKALLPLLKHQLSELRWAILNPREGAPKIRREQQIRKANGDTARLPVLRLGTIRPN
jgi:hypothetical protein